MGLKRQKRKLAWLTAAALVLLAQTAGAIHELDPQSLAPEHSCEFCIAAPGLDDANVADVVLPVSGSPVVEPVHFVAAIFSAAEHYQPPTRGPPATF